MRISELAKTVGLPIDTIRFYEKRGLLLEGLHFVRRDNKYRDYQPQAIDRLQLIKRGQAAGLTLAEICESIGAWESNRLTARQKKQFFEGKIKEIESRIAELEGMKKYLKQKINQL